MPDLDDRIETRLRADASRRADLVIPSLDTALDSVSEATRRRPRSTAWLAAAAIVLLVAALGVLLANLAGRRKATPAAPATTVHTNKLPPQHAPHVLRAVEDDGTAGVVAVPGDPTAYDVILLVEHRGGHDSCGFYDPRVTVAEQSATTVRLQVSGKRYFASLGDNRYQSLGCSGDQYKRFRIRLAQPIGDRTLFDTARDQVVVADPADYPDIYSVPSGFRRVGGHRPGAAISDVNGSRMFRAEHKKCRQPGYTETVGKDGKTHRHSLPPRTCFDFLTLTIGQQSPQFPVAHREQVSINGYAAQLAEDRSHRPDNACVTWQEAPSSRERVVCLSSDPGQRGGAIHDVRADVLRAARSVY